MRKLLVLASLLAAGCGGSSTGSSNPQPLAGTVGGRAFAIEDVKAIAASSGATPCEMPTPPSGSILAGVQGVALEVTSAEGGACDAFTSTGCTLHQSAQSVTVVYARIVPASQASPTPDVTQVPLATTGKDYAINADPTIVTPDGTTGYLTATYALALATDASCSPGIPPPVAAGTIRFSSVGDPITGYVVVTFRSGDMLQGDFSAPRCTGAGPDVCGLMPQPGQAAPANPLCPGVPACVP
jgi:hypothetical protein